MRLASISFKIIIFYKCVSIFCAKALSTPKYPQAHSQQVVGDQISDGEVVQSWLVRVRGVCCELNRKSNIILIFYIIVIHSFSKGYKDHIYRHRSSSWRVHPSSLCNCKCILALGFRCNISISSSFFCVYIKLCLLHNFVFVLT